MKKILLLLTFLYSFGFSYTTSACVIALPDWIKNYNYSVQAVSDATSCDSSYNNKADTISSGISSGSDFCQKYKIYYRYDESTNQTCRTGSAVNYFHGEPKTQDDPTYGVDSCSQNIISDSNGNFYSCSNGDYTILPKVDNGSYNDDGSISCNSGYSLTGSSAGSPSCWSNPENASYDDSGNLNCDSGFYATGSSVLTNMCMNTPYVPENSDSACGSGWSNSTNLMTGETTCLPPDYNVNNPDTGNGTGTPTDGSTGTETGGGDTSTGGDSGTGGSTGGDSGTGGSTGGDTSTGGSTGGDTSTGGTTDSGSGTSGGSGTSTGGTGGDTPTETTNDPSYMCEDGGKSFKTSSGMQSCDRTCEQVGLITNNLTNKCYGDKQCPEGETLTGYNGLTGEPFCYKLSTDPLLNTSEKLLSDIKNNTSLNKNSNTQLGAAVAKINSSNVFLKNIDSNVSTLNKGISDDSFKSTATKDSLNTMKTDNEGIFNSAKEAYSNLSNTYDSIKANYQSLKDFVDGKKSENATIDISSVTLPKKQVTIFGKTLRMDCFFNQDLNTLFAPIRPFVTFMLNIFFVFISIKLFMNYALANRGGIV